MSLGINRAVQQSLNKGYYNESRFTNSVSKPCIFLSHRSLDKQMVRKIGEYIEKAGIDIYLDENDQNLQLADAQNDDKKVVACIQKGLMESTHVLCILSRNTVSSWWVPYEVGYGEKGNKNIASLRISEISKAEVPSYLRVRMYLDGVSDFNEYLTGICNANTMPLYKAFSSQQSTYNISRDACILESTTYHPLYSYLDR